MPALLSVLSFAGALWWKQVAQAVPRLGQTASDLASDARWWLATLGLFWVYTSVSQIILILQRDRLRDVVENDIVPFRIALERWVVPRRLTLPLKGKIGQYLSPFRPHSLTVVSQEHDDEASDFATDIAGGFTMGHWNVKRITRKDCEPGLRVHYQLTQATAQARNDPREPKADRLMDEALKSIGIITDGGGGGSGGSIPEDTYELIVGPRPRRSVTKPEPWPFGKAGGDVPGGAT